MSLLNQNGVPAHRTGPSQAQLVAGQHQEIPSGFVHIRSTRMGTHWYGRLEDDGSWTMLQLADVQPILDSNIAKQNHNSGWSTEGKDKLMRRCASVPFALINKWKAELGVDFWNPDHQGAVNRLLDDIDYRKLRTALFRVGNHKG